MKADSFPIRPAKQMRRDLRIVNDPFLRSLRSASLVFACLIATFSPTSALARGDEIWGALILLTTESEEKPLHRKLKPFADEIQRVFGGNTLYLLGHKERDLEPGHEEWLIPSKRIFMRVRVKAREESAYLLDIDLYDGTTLLVSAEARLAKDAPLYIRGPQWGPGRLIALLNVK
jgi:hypothetical protein